MEAPWARLAVTFYRHPRTRRLSKDAQHLYLASILYCVEFSTDGRFPADETPYLASVSRVRSSLADELFDAEVWVKQDGDEVLIRDFLQHQTSREEIEARRARSQKAAEARWGKPDSDAKSPPHATGNAPSNASCNASREEESREERKPPDPPGFAEFWLLWPRREGRKAAVRAFSKAVKTVGSAEELLEQARTWLRDRDGMERNFVPHAATWLNQERWTDDPPPQSTEQAPPKQRVF